MLAFIADIIAFTPIDDAIIISLLGRDTTMPIWVLILLAILFGWLVLPKVVSYVKA